MGSRKCIPIFKILQILSIFLKFCQGQINVTEYKQMPALYEYDNFYRCLSRDESDPKYPAKYCMVFVQIQPNNGSLIWQQIDQMNAEKYNFRHDYLFRGVCMAKCKDLLNNNASVKNFDNGLLTIEHTYMFEQFYNRTLDRLMRYRYQKEIYECVNRDYVEKYNLSTRTFVNFCIDPQQIKEKDIYFNLTVLLIILIVLINILSSIYDARLKSQRLKQHDKNNYYEIKHTDKVSRYLTAFSIFRNLKRLVAINKSDIGLDLAFLDGFRSILCFLIVCEHVFLLQFYHIDNTEFIENIWRLLVARFIMHAVIWLELFFVLSGIFMCVKFEKSQYITAKSSFLDCVQVFVRLLVSRYLRYLPSLLFVIIFTANITFYTDNNSLVRNIKDANCLACRDVWWQNLLMINNYYMKSSCLMHTWYIAADFQLYALFLIILIIIAKYPKSKVLVLIGIAIIAAAINFSLNYVLKLDPVFMLVPESYRYFYFQNIETAKHLYFSSYTNINSFLLGIVSGLIYMKYLRKKPENKKFLGKILQNSPLIGWICIVGILYLGTTIMMHKETTVWTAAYGLLHRHVGLTIVVIIVILRGMCNGGGFLKYSAFRLLARISFQVYLWQIVVLLSVLSYFVEPIHANYILLYVVGMFLYVSSSLVAFAVALFVEYPIAEIINIIDIEDKIKPNKMKS